MRPTHYDALAEFLQYNCYALQELNLLGIWINGYKLCEPMKKLRQIKHLAVPFIGYSTFQPWTFQPQASIPDFSTPDSYGVEKFRVEMSRLYRVFHSDMRETKALDGHLKLKFHP